MTGRSRGRTRRPTLPCITIVRSPANDTRVILDALVSTPDLGRLLSDREGWIGEHRAELRALLQQMTNRLGRVIEEAGRGIAGGHDAPDGATAAGAGENTSSASFTDGSAVPSGNAAQGAGVPPSAGAGTVRDGDALPRPPALRNASRHREARRSDTALEPSAEEWRGGPLLR